MTCDPFYLPDDFSLSEWLIKVNKEKFACDLQ